MRYPILLVLAFTIGIGSAPARSARAVLLPDVLGHSGVTRERGTSAQEAAHGAGDLLGAPLGGVLIAVFGPVTVLLVDVVTLAAAASLIAVFVHCGRSARRREADAATGIRGYLAESRLGIVTLWRDPLLRSVAMFAAGTNALFVAMSSVLIPAFGNTVWHDSTQAGLVIAAFGAGVLLGTLFYGWLGARLPRRPTFCAAFLISGPPVFLVLALDPHPVVLIALVVVCSAGNGPVNPLLAGVKYDRIPVVLRGRVFGAMAALALAAMPVGTMVAGFLLDAAGPFGAATILGCVAFVLVLCPLVFPVWRALDDPPLVPSTS